MESIPNRAPSSGEDECVSDPEAQASSEGFVITLRDASVLQEFLEEFQGANTQTWNKILRKAMGELYALHPPNAVFDKKEAMRVTVPIPSQYGIDWQQPTESQDMVLQSLCPPSSSANQIYPEVVCLQCVLSGEQGWDWDTDWPNIRRRAGISGLSRCSSGCDNPTVEETFSRVAGILCWSCKGVVWWEAAKAYPSKVCNVPSVLTLLCWSIDLEWPTPVTGVGSFGTSKLNSTKHVECAPQYWSHMRTKTEIFGQPCMRCIFIIRWVAINRCVGMSGISTLMTGWISVTSAQSGRQPMYGWNGSTMLQCVFLMVSNKFRYFTGIKVLMAHRSQSNPVDPIQNK